MNNPHHLICSRWSRLFCQIVGYHVLAHVKKTNNKLFVTNALPQWCLFGQ